MRALVVVILIAVAALAAVSVWGQSQTPAPATPSAPSAPVPSTPTPSTPTPSTPSTPSPSIPSPSAPTPTIPTPGNRTPMPSPYPVPGQSQRQQPPLPMERAERPGRIPLSGKVVMEDGGPPPEPVRVESACGGRAAILAYTDSRGGFMAGSGVTQFADARSGNARSASRPPVVAAPAAVGPGCTLRAVLPGFRSTEINLMLLKDSFDPVTLILHPAEKLEGRTVSVTSVTAPKDARNAFEKATRAMRKGKWDEAQRQLERALQDYPRYAAAWSELANVYTERNQPEDARRAFREAIAIDPKFLSPYFGLAELAMHERKWQEMAECTGALLKLDPYDLPGAYAYDAMAHLNLDHLDAAEKSAREGLKVDQVGEVPKNHHLLAVVLMRKRDYVGAAEHLRKYLEAVPDASDAGFARRQLAACEEGGIGRAPDATASRQLPPP